MAETELTTVAEAESCGDGCDCEPSSSLLTATDPRLRRWAWWLTALTIGWNSLEAVIAIAVVNDNNFNPGEPSELMLIRLPAPLR